MANEKNLKPFPKGVSGNPKGLPKGTKHLATHIQDLLNDEKFSYYIQDSKEGYKEYKGVPIKAIVQTAIIKAVNGDKDSREWLAKYGYGSKLEIDVGFKENLVEKIIEGTGLREQIEAIRNEGEDDKQDNGNLSESSEGKA